MPDRTAEKRLCFVIMPFADFTVWSAARWTVFFEREIRPIVEACGYRCERSVANRGNILRAIVQNLASAHVVLADLTGLNVTVLYELGLRHALSARTLMITRDNPDTLPFDLKHYGCRQYSVDDPEARDSFVGLLRELLADVDANPEKEDSPVADFVSLRQQADVDRRADDLAAQLLALRLELDTLTHGLRTWTEGVAPSLIADYPALRHVAATGSTRNIGFINKAIYLSGLLGLARNPAELSPDYRELLVRGSAILADNLRADVGQLVEALARDLPIDDVEISPYSREFGIWESERLDWGKRHREEEHSAGIAANAAEEEDLPLD